MKRSKAISILQLPIQADYTVEEVRSAYATRARQIHPDSAEYVGSDVSLAELADARDCLLPKHKQTRKEVTQCPTCKGTGRVRGTGFATQTCVRCNGTGEIYAR